MRKIFLIFRILESFKTNYFNCDGVNLWYFKPIRFDLITKCKVWNIKVFDIRCKDVVIIKFEFVAKFHFLYKFVRIKNYIVYTHQISQKNSDSFIYRVTRGFSKTTLKTETQSAVKDESQWSEFPKGLSSAKECHSSAPRSVTRN